MKVKGIDITQWEIDVDKVNRSRVDNEQPYLKMLEEKIALYATYYAGEHNSTHQLVAQRLFTIEAGLKRAFQERDESLKLSNPKKTEKFIEAYEKIEELLKQSEAFLRSLN